MVLDRCILYEQLILVHLCLPERWYKVEGQALSNELGRPPFKPHLCHEFTSGPREAVPVPLSLASPYWQCGEIMTNLLGL